MSTSPKVKVLRALYVYKEGKLSFLQEAAIEIEEHKQSGIWAEAIEGDGYKGNYRERVTAITVGGLSANVYRRNTPGKPKNKKSMFAPYDFIVEIDNTYIVVAENFIEFLNFSKDYLTQPLPDEPNTSDLSGMREALERMWQDVSSISSSVDSISDHFIPKPGRPQGR